MIWNDMYKEYIVSQNPSPDYICDKEYIKFHKILRQTLLDSSS